MPYGMRFEVSSKAPISTNMASIFHGALMEIIPGEYAAYLHESRMHPYSQCLYESGGKFFWNVNCLDEDSEKTFREALSGRTEIYLKDKGAVANISQVGTLEVSYEELAREFYEDAAVANFSLTFLTPTAFKSRGRYVIYPDMRLIYQNLMLRYGEVVDGGGGMDDDALSELATNTHITGYSLHSTGFHLEGVKVPSFIGNLRFRIFGTETMARYARLLLRFGEFAGIGIKTSMGMGAVKLW